jgi:hypothetical protein
LLIYALYTPSGERRQFRNGKAIEANRFSACVQGDHSEASPEELEANARLMHAAPAMLEALVELNTELNLDALANHFPVAEPVVGKIKAAIRAAVGEQEENTQ